MLLLFSVIFCGSVNIIRSVNIFFLISCEHKIYIKEFFLRDVEAF
jgi:hypothetical protein